MHLFCYTKSLNLQLTFSPHNVFHKVSPSGNISFNKMGNTVSELWLQPLTNLGWNNLILKFTNNENLKKKKKKKLADGYGDCAGERR